MRPALRHPLAGLLALLLTAASVQAAANATAGATALTPAQVREDFQLTVDAVEAGLPDIHWRQTPREWTAAKVRAAAQLPTVTDAHGLFRVLRPMLAQIGEGHLSLKRGEALQRQDREIGRYLPLDLHWNTRGIFVIAGYGQAADIAPGTRVLAIDGQGPDALLRELMTVTGHDGAIPTLPMRTAGGRTYASLRYRLHGVEPTFRLSLRGPDGRVFAREVASVPRSARPSIKAADPSPLATLEWLDANTAYLYVPTFSNRAYRAAGADFTSTIKALFEDIDRKGARDLILDLRDNGGGSEPNESILFSYLVDAPLHKYAAVDARARSLSVTSLGGRRFDKTVLDDEDMPTQRALPGGRFTRLNAAPEGLMSRWTVFSPVFHGRLVVLAGGSTFSGGAELASMLFHTQRGVFVGEEVGGADDGNTSGYDWEIVLPNSRLELSVPLLQFRMNWRPAKPGRGVFPDCDVPPAVDTLDQRRDRAWKVAVALLKQDWTRPRDASCHKADA